MANATTKIDEKKDSVVIDLSKSLVKVLQLDDAEDDDDEDHITYKTLSEYATIFKAPSHLRSLDEPIYKPQLISIGPYHYNTIDDEGEDGNTSTKLGLLHNLMQRSRRRPVITQYFARCTEIAYAQLPEAKKRYQYESADISDDEFVKMLVMDGCFLIEFLIAWYGNDRTLKSEAVRAKLPVIRSDLLLVENQIPFFILEEFYKASSFPGLNKNDVELLELALVYFSGSREGAKAAVKCYKETATTTAKPKEIHHLLHLYHSLCLSPEFARRVNTKLGRTRRDKCLSTSSMPLFLIFRLCSSLLGLIWACFRPLLKALDWVFSNVWSLTDAAISCAAAPFHYVASKYDMLGNSSSTTGGQRSPGNIPNASRLRDIGFRFKKKRPLSSFSYVSLKGMTIEIPALSLNSTPPALLKNLIAYELCPHRGHRSFIAFAMLMDCLIDTAEDVAVLRKCGIIDRRFGDDEQVARLFNNLFDVDEGNEGTMQNVDGGMNHYLGQMFDYVGGYEEKKYHKVKLHQGMKKLFPAGKLFSSTTPWAAPSAIAASLVITLTVVSTVYTVMPYYRPPLQPVTGLSLQPIAGPAAVPPGPKAGGAGATASASASSSSSARTGGGNHGAGASASASAGASSGGGGGGGGGGGSPGGRGP